MEYSEFSGNLKDYINNVIDVYNTIENKITSGFAITPVKELYPTMAEDTNPAANICPEIAILNKPALSAIATPSAANIIGVQ